MDLTLTPINEYSHHSRKHRCADNRKQSGNCNGKAAHGSFYRAKLHGFGSSDGMGRCSKSKALCDRLLDLCDLVDNLCDHISQNSCDDDHGNGDGHDTAKLLGNAHSDGSCDRLRKHSDIFLMIKAKQFRHKQNTAKPGQRSGKDSGSHCLEIFFQQMNLLIKGHCQTDRCRGQQIADIFSTFIVIIIINMEEQKNTDNTDEFDMELRMKYDSLEIFNTQFSDETDIGELLDNALQKLPERCRNIFIMNKLEGKKQKEIAEELNLSINTVESQMGIAYKKLREELKDCLPLFIFLFAIS